jgi:glucose-regulated metallopeptidase M90
MVNLQWDEVYNLSVTSAPESSSIQIGTQQFNPDASLDFGPPLGAVPAMRLPQALSRYLKMSAGTAHPQLALLVFAITRQPFALNTYFPLTKSLDTAGLHQFHQLAQEIMLNRHFDVRLLGYNNDNRAGEFPEIAYFAAGHLAEIFFYRRDIVERLLSSPRHFWLYTTGQDFKKAGGVGGGCFNPRTGALQLVVSRLFEGFNGKTPGAAPFIHEFGHMLDYFDAWTGTIGSSEGFMPGLRQTDDDLYTPEARELFLKGKKLELQRYMRFYEGTQQPDDPLPIGHPYVFQTNGEFIAGYLEMFFRNPHYFAAQNPDLYQGFSLLFRQDPRQVWKEDFPYYIEQNRGFYLSGKKPGKPGVTV